MDNTLSSLLFYPFEKEIIPWPLEESKSIFINTKFIDHTFSNSISVQFFKPYSDTWQKHSITCEQTFDNNKQFDFAFVTLSKQKEESHYFLAQAINSLKPDGIIIAVAANNSGGNRLEKWMHELGLETKNLSKKKCRIVWAKKQNIILDTLKTFEANGALQEKNIGNYKINTQAGIYGWKNIDQGSKILTESLPENIAGIGADFGCGYGFLSIELLTKNPEIKKLYAIDADYRAIQCAKINLNEIEHKSDREFLWHDLTTRPDKLLPLDFVVMNPPFHEGKKADSNIGQKFIQTAAKSLRNKGTLYMVSNVHLPYEKILTAEFSNVEKIIEKNGFKVFTAIK